MLTLIEFYNKSLVSYPMEIYAIKQMVSITKDLVFLAVENSSIENFLLLKIFEVPRTIA